jgi:hypothetical protein
MHRVSVLWRKPWISMPVIDKHTGAFSLQTARLRVRKFGIGDSKETVGLNTLMDSYMLTTGRCRWGPWIHNHWVMKCKAGAYKKWVMYLKLSILGWMWYACLWSIVDVLWSDHVLLRSRPSKLRADTCFIIGHGSADDKKAILLGTQARLLFHIHNSGKIAIPYPQFGCIFELLSGRAREIFSIVGTRLTASDVEKRERIYTCGKGCVVRQLSSALLRHQQKG